MEIGPGTEHSFPIDGCRIHVEERGDGVPLVLLHGLTGSTRDWRHVVDLDAWAGAFRVIAIDLRGHGSSTNPDGRFSIGTCAADVVAVLDHLGVSGFRALGISLGAKSLLHLATRFPERVDAMVLVSAATHFPEAARAFMRTQSSALRSDEEWRVMRLKHKHGDDQIRALWRLPEQLANAESDLTLTARDLARISARTLLVHGDRDPLYPVEMAVEMYRAIPHAALWVVPGGGHTPVFGDARAEFAARARAFVAA